MSEEDLQPQPDVVDTPQADTPEPPKWTDDDANEARAFGWKPPEEWQGDKPPGHIESPIEWMDRVKRSKTFSVMQDRIAKFEQESAETSRRVAAMNDMALKRQQADFDRRMQEIQQSQRQAVEEADTSRFDRLEKERAAMVRPQAAETPQPSGVPAPPPEVLEYVQQNKWAQNEVALEAGARAIDFAMRRGHKFATAGEQMAYAESKVRELYPHLFTAPTPDPTPRPTTRTPDGPGLAGGRAAGAFDKLPADAKAAFQRFVGQNIYTNDAASRESYAREYNAQ